MRTVFVAALVSALIGVSIHSSTVLAQQKTVKACQDEWRANKDANQKAGITEKAYVDKCRAAADTTTAPTPAATPPSPESTPAAKPAPKTAAKPAPTTPSTPAGANQFAQEAQAKGRCPADTVVWVNTGSKVYHFAGTKNYGTTKAGAYMCEKDALAQGDRASKTEKHP